MRKKADDIETISYKILEPRPSTIADVHGATVQMSRFPDNIAPRPPTEGSHTIIKAPEPPTKFRITLLVRAFIRALTGYDPMHPKRRKRRKRKQR